MAIVERLASSELCDQFEAELAPHIAAMCARIAQVLAIDGHCINVKAKTAEGMGPVGRGESMEARAVCLLWRP